MSVWYVISILEVLIKVVIDLRVFGVGVLGGKLVICERTRVDVFELNFEYF